MPLSLGLHSISLRESQVVDRPLLARIARLPKLQRLTLDDVPLDAALVAELKGCPALRIVRLRRTGLDDEGLVHLAKIKTLRELHIAKTTKVSEAALKQLQEQRPELSIK